MEYGEYFNIGISSIKQHKLRSLLTMLGVIFGVAAVIAMMSIAGGARKAAIEQIELLGTNNIRIKHVELSGDQKAEAEYRGSRGLSLKDIKLIKHIVPGVAEVAPQKVIEVEIFHKDQKSVGRVIGTTPEYQQVVNDYPEKGRFISTLDMRSANKICILGAEIAAELFKIKNPLGEKVKIENTYYTVVGIMQNKNVRDGKGTVIEVRNLNRDIYIPVTTVFNRMFGSDLYDQLTEIAVKMKESERVIPASRVIDRLMLRSHSGVKDYEMIIPDELLARAQQTQRIFNMVMGTIAAISLLVGGIGIMNIMLATVTERVREIGVRRAVGASQRDIMFQFLNETVVISVSGGLLGILLGMAMAQGITWYANWDTVISLLGVAVAFGISVMVGIVFGLYPARKAAQMDPIEALRTE
jgi:putative ABC transport system permease protein